MSLCASVCGLGLRLGVGYGVGLGVCVCMPCHVCVCVLFVCVVCVCATRSPALTHLTGTPESDAAQQIFEHQHGIGRNFYTQKEQTQRISRYYPLEIFVC